MRKIFLFLTAFVSACFMLAAPGAVLAEETADLTELSASEAGITTEQAAAVSSEATETENLTGALIEIGNTTAEETTVIIRTTEDGATVDQTVQIDAATGITDDTGQTSDLSDWIAGDQMSLTATQSKNSGELKALRIRNRSFKRWHNGRNGWVKAVRADKNEMDVEWAGKIYTLNTASAKMVAGVKNPASLTDFQVGDRVRARVADDGDGNQLTWKAEIIVVLRRGNALFMRVTRWVAPAEITDIPDDTSAFPYVLTAKVLESKFYEKGDVNNLIGVPGTEIKIQVNENTKLARRFLGRAKVSEFMEGDQVRVVGRLNENSGNLEAVMIKNNSIQALGVARTVSEVVSIDSSANTLIVKPLGVRNPLTGKRKQLSAANNWTIKLQTQAKLYENGQIISLSDVAVGDIVRVRGIANRVQKTITAGALSVVTDRFKNLVE